MSRKAQKLEDNLRTALVLTAVIVGLLPGARDLAAQSDPPASNRQPSAVITVHNANATHAFRADREVVQGMLEKGIARLTSVSTPEQAWRKVVSSNDVVGLKVFSAPGRNSGTRPALVEAVVKGLLKAGLPTNHIIIWDRQLADLRLAGFDELARQYGVRLAAATQAGYDSKAFYDSAIIGTLVWGDLEFGKSGAQVGKKSFVTKLLSREITRTIVISPLLNHNQAGVAGILYSLSQGSVDNFIRFESSPKLLAQAVPEIYALPELSDKAALCIVDALICQYEGTERGLLHYSAALNEIRISRDPVALDVLSIRDLDRQRNFAQATSRKTALQLYSNAALLQLGIDEIDKIEVISLETETRPAATPPIPNL